MRAHDLFLEKCNDLPPFRSARVHEVENGIAKKISIESQIIVVHAQAAHLNALEYNDDILFLMLDEGPFILARALKQNEKPAVGFQNHQGEAISLRFGNSVLHISAQGEILIQTPSSFISLSPHGNIEMQAENIKQKAKKNIKLNANKHIELNSPSDN